LAEFTSDVLDFPLDRLRFLPDLPLTSNPTAVDLGGCGFDGSDLWALSVLEETDHPGTANITMVVDFLLCEIDFQ
jgi:hypothetical protein